MFANSLVSTINQAPSLLAALANHSFDIFFPILIIFFPQAKASHPPVVTNPSCQKDLHLS